jgi:hypothetical protein
MTPTPPWPICACCGWPWLPPDAPVCLVCTLLDEDETEEEEEP